MLVLSLFTSCDFNKVTPVTITLDSGILNKSAENVESTKNQKVILPSGNTIWDTDEYTFSGWSDEKGGESSYKAGAKYSSSSNVTLYAVWTVNPKITYSANGGTGDDIIEYQKSGGKLVIRNCTFTKEGYSFANWTVRGGQNLSRVQSS